MLSVVLLASTAAFVAPSIVVFYLLNWPRDVSISFNTSDCVLMLSSPNSELLLEYAPFENLHVFLFFFSGRNYIQSAGTKHTCGEREKNVAHVFTAGAKPNFCLIQVYI